MGKVADFFGINELSTLELYRKVFAELLGTFMFLYLGIASAIAWNLPAATMQIALTLGIALGGAITVVAHVSKGHLNPAVTLSFLVSLDVPFVRAVLYMIAQVVGAILAGFLVKVSLPSAIKNLGLTKPHPLVAGEKAFLVECLITFVFVMVVHACADKTREDTKGGAASLIGFTLTACNAGGMGFTGAGMNPARSFGPALVMMDFGKHHWVYWAGPFAGAVAASALYNLVLKNKAPEEAIEVK